MSEEVFVVPNEILFAEVEDRMARGESVTIPFAGTSMYPTLRDRKDRVTISPLQQSPTKGDVLLFRYQGVHILHRVRKVEGNVIVTRGDNCINEERIQRSDVVGILTRVYRSDQVSIDCDGFGWKLRSGWALMRNTARRMAARWFNKRIRIRISPVYFLLLALLMWLPLDGLGIPLNNFVFGLRLDHLLHATVYIPCTLFLMDIPRLKGWRLWLLAIMVAVVTETVQYFLPYRGFDVNDLLANFFGVTLGWVIVHYLR